MVNEGHLEVLAMKRLRELSRVDGGRESVPFVEFHACLSTSSNVSEAEAWGLLKSMEESGLVEIDPFDGIRLVV